MVSEEFVCVCVCGIDYCRNKSHRWKLGFGYQGKLVEILL